jgi:hypothetical protein
MVGAQEVSARDRNVKRLTKFSLMSSKIPAAQDEPRDPSLETKVTLPKTWYRESNGSFPQTLYVRLFCSWYSIDGLGTSAMFLSGLIIVTRNRRAMAKYDCVLLDHLCITSDT